MMLFESGTKVRILMCVDKDRDQIISYTAKVIEDSEDFIFIEDKFGERIRIDKSKCIQIQEKKE